MRGRSLLTQMAVVTTIWCAAFLALAWSANLQNHHAQQHQQAIVDAQRSMAAPLLRILGHHHRSARQARDALTAEEPRRALQRIASEYLPQLRTALSEANRATRAARSFGDPELSLDLERLEGQLERIERQARSFSASLDALLEVTSLGDELPVLEALASMQEADREMSTMLELALALHTRARFPAKPQTTRLGTSVFGVGLLAGLIATLWLFLSGMGLRKLAVGQPSHLPRSKEEDLLRRDLLRQAQQAKQADTTLGERTLDAQRASQTARRLEHELALFKLYNDNLVNSLRTAVIATDTHGNITEINRPARKLLGFSADDVGTPMVEHPLFASAQQQRQSFGDDLKGALGEQQTVQLHSVPLHGTSGNKILVDLTVVPNLDESGAARGLLWMADDVTEGVETKNQLLAAERLAAVGRISTQVAHEIRNPLSAIGLNAELLEEEFAAGLEEEQQQEAISLLRAIGSEIERLTHITEGYLKLTRMPDPQLRPTDLNQVVHDFSLVIGQEMRAHHIDLEVKLSPNVPWARADSGQLRQALLNIARNSRDAMPDGGTLTLTTTVDDDGCEIHVSDTGHGISPDIANRVFEPFYTTKPDGTGLGLSLTQQMVEDQGGTVQIKQLQPGTEITLRLPAAATQRVTNPQSSAAAG